MILIRSDRTDNSMEAGMRRFAVLMAIAASLAGAEAALAQGSSAPSYQAQVSTGQVALEARPEWRDGRMAVALSANTHSVDLSTVDLAESVRLLVGATEYAPVEAGSLSGHHARTELVFEVPERPAAFALRIRGVPDVDERLLEWPVE